MGERPQHIFSHDAILLLHNAFAIQSYCTYCGHHPVFSHPHFNAMMSFEKFFAPFPTFATRPIRLGGLGIQSAVQLTPSASAHHSQDLVHKILPPRLLSTDLLHNLCVVTGPSAISSSGQSILLPEGMG